MSETQMRVAIIGTGYVGLVSGAALAYLGHQVVCVDNDPAKIDSLRRGTVPIYEPGLAEMLAPLAASGAISFTEDLQETVKWADIVFICVGTPSTADGSADMSAVKQVAYSIGAAMDDRYRVIVNKSTVPVGTGDWVTMVVMDGFCETGGPKPGAPDFDVVSNPEFLREGSALTDTFYPDRIVIGTRSARAIEVMEDLYRPLVQGSFRSPGVPAPKDRALPVPFVVTDLTSAEMIKYAANAFLALKISYINEIASICECVGADVRQVARGIGYDQRIGSSFLSAGVGWGGSCFGKDLSALRHIAGQYGMDPDILRSAIDVNHRLRETCFRKLQGELKMVTGKSVGILGLAFKPFTDDLRDAPALTLVDRLLEAGARVKAYDPVAMEKAARARPEVRMAEDPYSAAQDCDAVILVTEWPEFRELDLERLRSVMHTPVFIDGRNVFDPAEMAAAGFRYSAFGV